MVKQACDGVSCTDQTGTKKLDCFMCLRAKTSWKYQDRVRFLPLETDVGAGRGFAIVYWQVLIIKSVSLFVKRPLCVCW